MATLQECEIALGLLIHRLGDVDDETRRKHSLDRSVSCTIPDIGVIYTGRIVDGVVHDLSQSPLSTAQIRFTVGSDDLVALTQGALSVGSAWASGKLKIEASVMDLLRLRSLA